MMKKGSITLLVNIIFAVMILFVVFKTTQTFVKPLLHDEKKSLSYQSFQVLKLKMNNLLKSESQTASTDTRLIIENQYFIWSFDYDEEGEKKCLDNFYEGGKTFELSKPELCKEKGCICLFKIKDEGNAIGDNEITVVDCIYSENTIFFSLAYENDDIYEYSSCEMYGQTFEEEYEEYEELKIEYRKGIYFHGKSSDKDWGSKRIWIDIENPFGKKRTAIEEQMQKIFDEQEGWTSAPKNKEIFIDIYDNDLNRLRYKFKNFCPFDSDEGCIEKHYDYVVREEIEGEKNSYACEFDEEENKCIKKEVQECETGPITDDCACGNNTYEFGWCINGEHHIFELADDYCFKYEKKIGCKDVYNDANAIACIFDICNISKTCQWDPGGKNKCEPCFESCNCGSYEGADEFSWQVDLDPCDCDEDEKHPDDVCYKETTNEIYMGSSGTAGYSSGTGGDGGGRQQI